MLKYYPRLPNFTPFYSTIGRFPDTTGRCSGVAVGRRCTVIEVIDFSIGYNGEFEIFEKKNH